MMRRITKAGLTLAAVAAVSFGPGLAQAAEDAAALTKALPEAAVSLEQGLRAGEREGKPISGKFEIEDGALQLSVYTAKGGKFSEVIVDHKSGAIKEAEPITGDEDLKDAKEQDEAMNAARVSLSDATAQAVSANAGYRAVSVMPAVKNGHPVAEVRLTSGTTVKAVEQKLD
jgi:hypothetical protein